ncbi:AraC family transcriptional regulator [Dongia deserti]|uniref:AraC family transcriptional regulator n=1 Tax=Dongia deserti TaxID=2268030 RepID=UPI000E649AF3|nr:AraC family transcriptional regulator [Dongia deserti]
MNYAGRVRYRDVEFRDLGRDATIPCDPDNLPELLDHLADVYFYVKDVNSRWQECNSAILTLFNAAKKSDVLGKTDWDFYPEEIAKEIIQDDRSVVETGRPIVSKLEVIVDQAGRLLWVLTTKTPARNKDGQICGLLGLTRPVSTTDMLPEGYRQFSKVIAHVEDRYRTSLEVSELAEIACLSESQFRKRFVKLFKIPPSKFINRIRVQTAAKLLLSSDDPIAEIALQCGFCDQSYFTRQFSSFFGLTPKRYRDRGGKRSMPD